MNKSKHNKYTYTACACVCVCAKEKRAGNKKQILCNFLPIFKRFFFCTPTQTDTHTNTNIYTLAQLFNLN